MDRAAKRGTQVLESALPGWWVSAYLSSKTQPKNLRNSTESSELVEKQPSEAIFKRWEPGQSYGPVVPTTGKLRQEDGLGPGI